MDFDAIIVGGGPAGLSAALILGRCRRRVLLCDSAQPRNASSQAMHGFITRDGIRPADFLKRARMDLSAYPSVTLKQVEVTGASRRGDGFSITLADGQQSVGRKLMLATGVCDDLPDIEGVQPNYGRGVHHCPYCDGWELRDQPIAVYGQGSPAVALALELFLWSKDLTICSDGPAQISKQGLAKLAAISVPVNETRILRVEGDGRTLQRIDFADGTQKSCRALFFRTTERQKTDLAMQLGCELTDDGLIATKGLESKNVSGVYVAGNVMPGLHLVIVAASEGAQAAYALNEALVSEDFG